MFLDVSGLEGQNRFFKGICVFFRVGQKAMSMDIEQRRQGIVFSEEGD